MREENYGRMRRGDTKQRDGTGKKRLEQVRGEGRKGETDGGGRKGRRDQRK